MSDKARLRSNLDQGFAELSAIAASGVDSDTIASVYHLASYLSEGPDKDLSMVGAFALMAIGEVMAQADTEPERKHEQE